MDITVEPNMISKKLEKCFLDLRPSWKNQTVQEFHKSKPLFLSCGDLSAPVKSATSTQLHTWKKTWSVKLTELWA